MRIPREQRADGKRGIHINRATGTGSSTFRIKGRGKRPRILEAEDHRDV